MAPRFRVTAAVSPAQSVGDCAQGRDARACERVRTRTHTCDRAYAYVGPAAPDRGAWRAALAKRDLVMARDGPYDFFYKARVYEIRRWAPGPPKRLTLDNDYGEESSEEEDESDDDEEEEDVQEEEADDVDAVAKKEGRLASC